MCETTSSNCSFCRMKSSDAKSSVVVSRYQSAPSQKMSLYADDTRPVSAPLTRCLCKFAPRCVCSLRRETARARHISVTTARNKQRPSFFFFPNLDYISLRQYTGRTHAREHVYGQHTRAAKSAARHGALRHSGLTATTAFSP